MISREFWRGRRVFLTGHTGFKGSWTSLLLASLGAEVYGYALAPESDRGLFVSGSVARSMRHLIGDVRDLETMSAAVSEARPEVVIHMAAQALVRQSYKDPVGTYATNVMGTVNLLEAVRRTPEVRAVVVVTSDKCYDNVGWTWPYREIDPLGGHDPYSNSKGCAELVTDSYRRSFFHSEDAALVASGRAGNVIGGGDWAIDRLVPDAVRAFVAGESVRVRNPHAVRPWQHVLDPILAYLELCERLVTDGPAFAEGWNFGPAEASMVPVSRVLDGMIRLWGGSARWDRDQGEHPHEASYLKLDCSKAHTRLGWRPLIDLDQALRLTVDWYRAFEAGADMRTITHDQIGEVVGRGAASRAAA